VQLLVEVVLLLGGLRLQVLLLVLPGLLQGAVRGPWQRKDSASGRGIIDVRLATTVAELGNIQEIAHGQRHALVFGRTLIRLS
jgi:hypothetical protein